MNEEPEFQNATDMIVPITCIFFFYSRRNIDIDIKKQTVLLSFSLLLLLLF